MQKTTDYRMTQSSQFGSYLLAVHVQFKFEPSNPIGPWQICLQVPFVSVAVCEEEPRQSAQAPDQLDPLPQPSQGGCWRRRYTGCVEAGQGSEAAPEASGPWNWPVRSIHYMKCWGRSKAMYMLVSAYQHVITIIWESKFISQFAVSQKPCSGFPPQPMSTTVYPAWWRSRVCG